MVDAGLPWNAKKVLGYIRSIGRNPDDLRLILMTHSHPDHASGALAISRRTGAKVVAHPDDTKVHADSEVSLSYLGVFTSLKVPVPFFQRTPVAQVLHDGHRLPTLGGVRVIHTPGHTPGSVCYLLENRSLLFSGDSLFSDGKRLSRSVSFPGSNSEDYRNSLTRLANLEFDVLCGGHGQPLMGGASERLRELLARRPDLPSWSEYVRSIPKRIYLLPRPEGRARLSAGTTAPPR